MESLTFNERKKAMKKSVVLVGLFSVFFFGTSDVRAEEKIALEGNTLVVSEVREVKRISNVPAGLSPENAYKLVTGELKEITVRNETGKAKYFFSFPLKGKTMFLDRIVTYNGKWEEKKISRTEESRDWMLTIFWFIISAVGILVVSALNQLAKTGARKLFVFYGAVLAAIFAGVFAGMFVGTSVGILVGVFAGVFAGVFSNMFLGTSAGILVGVSAGAFAGVFAGAFASGLASIFAGMFAGKQGCACAIVLLYLVFVGATMLVSYIVANIVSKSIREIKNRFPAIKS